MQCQVTLWILGAFQTLSTTGIEAIASLIPIHLYLKKLSSYDQLWIATLTHNYTIKSLLKERYTPFSNHYWLLLENMTSKQWINIKSSVSNSNSCLNGIFSLFDSLNEDFCLSSRLSNSFSSYYSFYKADHHSNKSKKAHCCKLNEVVFNTSNKSNIVIIISDASIKNNVAMSITHIHSFNQALKTTLYHAINVTSTEAKLFVLRWEINQVISITNFSHIIVITDALHKAYIIFESNNHPYQLQSITISKELRTFFNQQLNNSIEFWDCSSSEK